MTLKDVVTILIFFYLPRNIKSCLLESEIHSTHAREQRSNIHRISRSG